MKFSVSAIIGVAAAAASVAAQRAMIAYPTNGTDVQAGSDLLIMVARPDFQSSAVEVGIVLGFSSCPDDPSTCPDPALSAGNSILYNGPYNPQFGGAWFLPPHENFTVTIPEDAEKGYAQITLTHFSLIGAENSPFSDHNAMNVNVV